MLLRVLWILAGYVLACVAFALVLVGFVFTPAELVSTGAGSGRFSMAGFQLLASFIQVLIFAAPLAFFAAAMAEWRGINEWIYYALVNNYAFTAFMTGGFAAGMVYWLVAGRSAAERRRAAEAEAAAQSAAAKAAAASRRAPGPVT